MFKQWFKFIVLSLTFLGFSTVANAWDKGIYLTQYSLEQPGKLDYLIREAKATGINTFVIDHDHYSSHYASAIAKVKSAGIKYIPRVVVFSDGGNAEQIHSKAHWEEKLKLVNDAIKAGADGVQ